LRVNKILEKVDVRGYDSPMVELEDQLARAREYQMRVLNTLECLGKNVDKIREVLGNFTQLIKKK
jgi:hypothetical protein